MPPHIHYTEIAQDNRIILSKGSKLENQHTRMTLGTLSWVYKPSDYLMVIGPGSPCWSYQSQDLQPAKTERRQDAHSSTEMRFVRRLLWPGRLTSDSVTATSWTWSDPTTTLLIEGHTRIQLCVSSDTQDVQMEKGYHILDMVSP